MPAPHQVLGQNGIHTTVTTRCVSCRKYTTHTLDTGAYQRWMKGEMIQRAFPLMELGKREQLISGTCPPCWDEMFKEDTKEPIATEGGGKTEDEYRYERGEQ